MPESQFVTLGIRETAGNPMIIKVAKENEG